MVRSHEAGTDFVYDDAASERAETVLRQAFIAAQLGMPSEDAETAVDSLWIILEALLVDHLAPTESTESSRSGHRVDVGNHWRRMVITAVTHTFVLSGGFVQPEELTAVVEEKARMLTSGKLWHTRRPPAHGALVLVVHTALLRLDETAKAMRFPSEEDAIALRELIACATVGVVLAGESLAARPDESQSTDDEPRSRWSRSSETVAASFGIPEAELQEISRRGWVCADCGCLFLGRVEAGIAYPDRFAPIGRTGACDAQEACSCHSAPLQRRVR